MHGQVWEQLAYANPSVCALDSTQHHILSPWRNSRNFCSSPAIPSSHTWLLQWTPNSSIYLLSIISLQSILHPAASVILLGHPFISVRSLSFTLTYYPIFQTVSQVFQVLVSVSLALSCTIHLLKLSILKLFLFLSCHVLTGLWSFMAVDSSS